VGWRTFSALGLLATTAVAAVAPVVLASAASAHVTGAPSSVSEPAVETVAAPAAQSEATASVGIKITVHVKGGTLQLSTGHVMVDLQPTAPGHYAGRYEGVRVLDARGTRAGWQLTARTSMATPAGTVRVTPDAVVPVEGSPDGLLAAGAADAGPAGALLGGASEGHGAGVYELSGLVELDVPGGVVRPAASLDLALDLR
jgi:hypothetical protein